MLRLPQRVVPMCFKGGASGNTDVNVAPGHVKMALGLKGSRRLHGTARVSRDFAHPLVHDLVGFGLIQPRPIKGHSAGVADDSRDEVGEVPLPQVVQAMISKYAAPRGQEAGADEA